MKREIKKNKVLIISIFFVMIILMLSIGWSSFSQKLAINISGEVRIPADIRVTGIYPVQTSNDGISNSEDYNVKNINGNITLPRDNSSVTYRVEVTNFEGPEMGIFSLTGLPDNLEYVLDGYTLKEKICDVNNNCKLGIKKEFNITIRYKSGRYNANSTNFNFKLDFDFRGFFNIKYVNIVNNNYPSYIIQGDNLNITFQNLTNVGVIYQNRKLVRNSEFTFNNNTLNLNNIQADVEITDLSVLYNMMNFYSVGSDMHLDFQADNSAANSNIYTINESLNNAYPIHYFHGNITNNNLIFANHCWKIVRTTDTGGVKIIYNGNPSNNTCNNTSTNSEIGQSIFNSSILSASDMGYKIGTYYQIQVNGAATTPAGTVFGNSVSYSGGVYTLQNTYVSQAWGNSFNQLNNYRYTCFSTGTVCDSVGYIVYTDTSSIYYYRLYNGVTYDTYFDGYSIDSEVKKVVDNWYASNLIGFANKLEDSVWCNARTFASGGGYFKNGSLQLTDTDTEAYNRLTITGRPSLSCLPRDSFSVNTNIGNGALQYPIALLSMDEAMYAGVTMNHSSYLNTGSLVWTMTPFRMHSIHVSAIFIIGLNGDFGLHDVQGSAGIRPVVSLIPGTTIINGDGTPNNPYFLSGN